MSVADLIYPLDVCISSEKVKSKKSDLISALIVLKWKIPALEQRGWYWSSSCRHKSRHWAAGPTGNSGGETGGSMSVMEPLVTQRPWQEEGRGFDCLLFFFSSAWWGKWGWFPHFLSVRPLFPPTLLTSSLLFSAAVRGPVVTQRYFDWMMSVRPHVQSQICGKAVSYSEQSRSKANTCYCWRANQSWPHTHIHFYFATAGEQEEGCGCDFCQTWFFSWLFLTVFFILSH